MNLVSRNEAIEKGLVRYFTGVPCKKGHVAERQTSNYGCMICLNDRSKAFSKKKYSEDPDYREKINEKNREYNKTETYKEYNRRRVTTDEYRSYRVNYLAQDHMRQKKRAYDKERQQTDNYKSGRRDRYKHDIQYKIACLARTWLTKSARKAKAGNAPATIDVSGLIQRIEFNFKKGMSWENHGDWHIDHIKPIAAFVAQGRSAAEANTLCNLRPEWKSDNMLKSSKFNGVMYRYKSTQSIRNEEDKG